MARERDLSAEDSRPPPYKEANEILARNIRSWCKQLLPKGQAIGEWWVVSVPWRQDKNPSLGVSLTSGHWEDFGRGERGSPVDLLARLSNQSPAEIAFELVPE